MELTENYLEIEREIRDRNITKREGISLINFLIGYLEIKENEVDFTK